MSSQMQKVFTADVSALQALLAVSAFLFAFGLWFADSTGGAYNSMLAHAPATLWGLGFFVYGCAKIFLAIQPRCRLVAYSTLILGIYLWLFTLLSFADNPTRPMGSADMIMFVLVIVEVWVGAANIAGAKQ